MKKPNISNFDNNELLKFFEDEIIDLQCFPFGDVMNNSGFEYKELREEILNRMNENSARFI